MCHMVASHFTLTLFDIHCHFCCLVTWCNCCPEHCCNHSNHLYNLSPHGGENMEQVRCFAMKTTFVFHICKTKLVVPFQDCVEGVYQSLGMSVGAEFTSEDVSLLFRKVFHSPSSTEEAHRAMKKVTTRDTKLSSQYSCVIIICHSGSYAVLFCFRLQEVTTAGPVLVKTFLTFS